MKNNPYIGPRPYERQDRHHFFGRAREARDLLALIKAERAVLFYAQSGAGKTSLLNAQIIPALEEEGFHVLPVARVGSDVPPGIDPKSVPNIFVLSALMGLAQDPRQGTGKDVPAETLLHPTLLSFLRQLAPASGGEARPPILILDQFEEILTTHRDRWQDAQGFFLQLQAALREIPTLGVVLAMREDHLAEIDPYAPLLSKRLRTRFRMELLSREAALEAVKRPAQDAGCPFDSGVAERLVDDLSRIRVQRYSETAETEVTGPFVEPVQLQVVCQRLWENLPDAARMDHTIQWEEVGQFGNIDRALTDFYESALNLAKTSEPSQGWSVTERQLRRWFSEQLITPMQTRGLALRGKDETAGLPNAAVNILENRHLIRADVRAGSTWYELAHDRLVEPILQSNRAWEAARQTPLRLTAKRWQEAKSDILLYRDKALTEALAWTPAHAADVEPYETEFLQASQQAQQTRHRIERIRRTATLGLVIGLIITALLAIFAFYGWRQAQEQRQIAHTRQLAVQAALERSTNTGSWTRAALLAVESLRRSPDLEASMTLFSVMDRLARPVSGIKHAGQVNAVAFSPDGRRMASAYGQADKPIGGASVWEAATGARMARLNYEGRVYAICFSPNGEWIVSGNDDDTARVWNAVTGQEAIRVSHPSQVNAVAYSPNGQWVASGYGRRGEKTGGVIIWKAATGEEIVRIQEINAVMDVSFSPDGQRIVSKTEDGTRSVWEATTAQSFYATDQLTAVAFSSKWLALGDRRGMLRVREIATGREVAWEAHAGPVWDLAFSPDEQWLASGSDDFKARVWNVPAMFKTDTAIGVEVARMEHEGRVETVAFSRDGRWLLTKRGGVAYVWEAATGRQVARIEHESLIAAVLSPDGRWVVSAGRDGWARVWDVSATLNRGAAIGRPVFRVQYPGRVNVLSISPDRRQALSGDDEGVVRLWDIPATPGADAIAVRELTRMKSDIQVLVSSPDSKWTVAGSRDGAIKIWETATGREVVQIKHRWEANAVAFSPDGRRAASGGGDGTVLVWEIATGKPIAQMNHEWEVNSVAFNPDGKRVSSASRNGTARVWDAATGQQISSAKFGASFTAIALSPDARWVATGSDNGAAQVWEATTGRPVSFVKHLGKVNAIAFSPDSKWVVSSGQVDVASMQQDGTARIWEAATGREVARIQHKGFADAVAFSPDGRWAETITYDTALVWWWKPEDLIAQACSHLTRNLTIKEWSQYVGDALYRPTCPNLPTP